MLIFGGEHKYFGGNWFWNSIGDLLHKGHEEVWVYDFEDKIWIPKSTQGALPIYGNSNAVIDDDIYVFEEGQLSRLRNATWNSTGPPTGINNYGSSLIAVNGHVCKFGGALSTDDGINVTSNFTCIDTKSPDVWKDVELELGSSQTPDERYDFSMVTVGNEAYLFGGRAGNSTLNDLHKLELNFQNT